MAGSHWPSVTVDPFDEAISEGDARMQAAESSYRHDPDERLVAATLAVASYQKATAIATSRVAGRLRLIESTALEATEAASER